MQTCLHTHHPLMHSEGTIKASTEVAPAGGLPAPSYAVLAWSITFPKARSPLSLRLQAFSSWLPAQRGERAELDVTFSFLGIAPAASLTYYGGKSYLDIKAIPLGTTMEASALHVQVQSLQDNKT